MVAVALCSQTVLAQVPPPAMLADASAVTFLALGPLPAMLADASAITFLAPVAQPAMLADASATTFLALPTSPAVLALRRLLLLLRVEVRILNIVVHDCVLVQPVRPLAVPGAALHCGDWHDDWSSRRRRASRKHVVDVWRVAWGL